MLHARRACATPPRAIPSHATCLSTCRIAQTACGKMGGRRRKCLRARAWEGARRMTGMVAARSTRIW